MLTGWLRRWRPWQLILATVVYWVALIAVELGRALILLQRVSRPGAQGNFSVSAQASNSAIVLSATISDAAKHVLWSGSINLVVLILLIAAPPLLLWFAWLAARPRRGLPPPAEPTPNLVASPRPDVTRSATRASDRPATPAAPADNPPPAKRM